MNNYGRKIINALFSRRKQRTAVCAELESKSEALSHRSDIGVLEAGLSPQQHGDYEQSTRTAAHEDFGEKLISIAKTNGLFIERKDWHLFGEQKRLPSGESVVFLNDAGDRVIKVRNPFAKAAIKNLHAPEFMST